MSDTSQTSAERTRAYRERRRNGARIVPVTLSEAAIKRLVQAGMLAPDQRDDPAAIGATLVRLVEREPVAEATLMRLAALGWITWPERNSPDALRRAIDNLAAAAWWARLRPAREA